MTLQKFAVFLGMLSILIFQFEQFLREWISTSAPRVSPAARWHLGIAARTIGAIKAYMKSKENILPVIQVMRWSAIIMALFASFIELLR